MPDERAKSTPVEFKGKLIWELIFDYNHIGKDATGKYEKKEVIREKYQARTVVETVNETAKTTTTTNNVSLNLGAATKLLSASIGSSFENSKNVCEFMSKRMEENKDYEREWEIEEKYEHEVGPNTQLALYRIYFMAPGVVCPGGLVTNRQDDKDVHIMINVQTIELIRNLIVVYGDNPSDAPTENRVQEIKNQNDVQSDDLNKDFRGKYTWLVAEYTTNVEDAASSFLIYMQSQEKHGMEDIARGTGGDFRYVVPVKNQREKKKINEINLLRSSNSVDVVPDGYSGKSIDINRGRKKDFLYLIWKTVDT
ncbi:unnamed protein product [Rotaria socialis]|uniref:Uncharacterized protein n=1 Tax=Rotaria socialis TaxID=392032 RepID=A0A817YNB2_9BILA|nr:unnamed protein product [Rotaria socialis]CAF4563284.1 unnamed protein product [Rotaria socialis]